MSCVKRLAIGNSEENICVLLVYTYTSGLGSWEMTSRLRDFYCLTSGGTYPSYVMYYVHSSLNCKLCENKHHDFWGNVAQY